MPRVSQLDPARQDAFVHWQKADGGTEEPPVSGVSRMARAGIELATPRLQSCTYQLRATSPGKHGRPVPHFKPRPKFESASSGWLLQYPLRPGKCGRRRRSGGGRHGWMPRSSWSLLSIGTCINAAVCARIGIDVVDSLRVGSNRSEAMRHRPALIGTSASERAGFDLSQSATPPVKPYLGDTVPNHLRERSQNLDD